MLRVAVLALCIMIGGCAGVRQEDTQSWVGASVATLDLHPIFLTLPVVKTKAADGTEIRNYINGRNIGSCSRGGMVIGHTVDLASYHSFTNCMQSFAACNNIFYIRGGRIVRYTPVGTGGARCYTDETTRPSFIGSTNAR